MDYFSMTSSHIEFPLYKKLKLNLADKTFCNALMGIESGPPFKRKETYNTGSTCGDGETTEEK
jgi:hypothetical protein